MILILILLLLALSPSLRVNKREISTFKKYVFESRETALFNEKRLFRALEAFQGYQPFGFQRKCPLE